MSDVKHTPGPWYQDDSMIEHGCCWEAAIVADVPKGEGSYGGTKALVAECLKMDVLLIAAAPDLLDAAKDAYEWMNELPIPTDGCTAKMKVLFAAIAKAEGRT